MRALTQLKLAGTKSFRLSSSQLFGYGVNAQNTDKSIVDIFEAPPGWSIVQVDQAGAEALVVAYLAPPGRYRELFEYNLKPHIYVALHLFIEKFRVPNPVQHYWLKRPQELQALPEWARLEPKIADSKYEYNLGKKTGHACFSQDVEVRTPLGWTRIGMCPKEILVYDAFSGKTHFEHVAWNSYQTSENLFKLSDGVYATRNHKLRHAVESRCLVTEEIGDMLIRGSSAKLLKPNGELKPVVFTEVAFSGYVYCPTTSTGYFVARGEDKESFVSGNSNYKMGPRTFRESCLKESDGALNLTLNEARYFLEIYKLLFPEIVEWQNEVIHEVETTRRLRNLLGYPRRFDRLITDGYSREAISWIPQSTVGCITHRAYIQAASHISDRGLSWRLFNNKHDSYACLVPDEEIREACNVLSRYINQTLIGRDAAEFTMKSEVQVGKNMKKQSEDNPLGLTTYKL